MTPKLLLVGGSPRSGTTAVLQVLNSNPHVFLTSEENILKSIRALEALLGTRSRRTVALKNGMRELSPRETLTLDNIHSHNFTDRSVWPTLEYIYRFHHAQLHPNESLIVWGDKLPAYARDIASVLALPNALYLHITRHPFDVVNSMLRRLDATRRGLDWWKGITEFDAMLEAWVTAYEAIEAIEGSPRVFHLHYEQLVFDFASNASAINRFLGVDLPYQNILVNDPALHFDQSHLNAEMRDRITAHPAVQRYLSRHPNTYSAAQGQQAIQGPDTLLHEPSPTDQPLTTAAASSPQIRSTAEPIKVFIACTAAEWLPMRVLEYTIREHTDRLVEVVALEPHSRTIPTPIDRRNHPRTPFSFQRFLIPALCNHAGRAIYLDADMQVFADIGQLWDQPLHNCDLLTVGATASSRRPQFSVMLLDCAALDWKIEAIVADLDAGRLDYNDLMIDMRVASRIGTDLPTDWNSLERYIPGQTRLLHFTDMESQPWVSCSHPLGSVWVSALRRAMTAGFISRDELAREVAKGHVRPSLATQMSEGIDAPQSLTRAQKASDSSFTPPYRHLVTTLGHPWTRAKATAKSLLDKMRLR